MLQGIAEDKPKGFDSPFAVVALPTNNRLKLTKEEGCAKSANCIATCKIRDTGVARALRLN